MPTAETSTSSTAAGGGPPSRRPASTRLVALAPALVAASLWGLGGTAAQALFVVYGFPPAGLVTLRLVLSGGVLWLLLRPAFPRSHAGAFVPFGIFGLFGVQITFFLAIDYSNAATTTLLQSLQLPMIAVWEAGWERKPVGRAWGLAVALAVIGTALVVLGRPGFSLTLTPLGLFFGIASAVTAAYYTLASRPLVRSIGPWSTVTWGFLIGGLVSLPFGLFGLSGYSGILHAPPPLPVDLLVAFVVVFSTLLAFGLFLTSVRKIGASEAAVATAMEPIAAAIAALLFLGVLLTGFQYFGGGLILLGVGILSLKAGKDRPPAPTPRPPSPS